MVTTDDTKRLIIWVKKSAIILSNFRKTTQHWGTPLLMMTYISCKLVIVLGYSGSGLYWGGRWKRHPHSNCRSAVPQSMSTECWVAVGPSSDTLDQHWSNIGLPSSGCCRCWCRSMTRWTSVGVALGQRCRRLTGIEPVQGAATLAQHWTGIGWVCLHRV